MTPWRRQLPVHSPVSADALLAGIRAVASHNGGPAEAEARVVALLKERYAAHAVLLTDSGTGALTVALLDALQRRPGAAAALPAYACYDVATAADGADAPVLLYDLDPCTLAPDLAQVQEMLSRGAGAVVIAHLYGYPVDLAAVNRLASDAGAIVIEDAAQAGGATLHGRPAGSQASLAVLSFGRGKGLTGGGGGALLALDRVGEEIVEQVRRDGRLGTARRGWRELAAITAQWLFQRPNLYAIPTALPGLHLGETIYRAPRALRAPAVVSCPVIAASWELAEHEVEVRRRNAERLLEQLSWHPAFRTITPARGARPGHLRLPVLASPVARRAVRQTAARSLGVMAGYPKALCDLEPFRSRCLNLDDGFPGSRLLATQLCTLPTHSRLSSRDVAALERWIRALGKAIDG